MGAQTMLGSSGLNEEAMRVELLHGQGGSFHKTTDYVPDVEVGPVPMNAIIGSVLMAPCMIFAPIGCFYCVDANTEAAVLHCGQLTHMEDQPGCHCTYPAGRDVKTISVKQRCLDLPDIKVVDRVGNPVVVSAVINYRVVNSRRALLNVDAGLDAMVRTNGMGALKHAVQTFDYEQLRSDSASFNTRLMQMLQPMLDVIGVRVTSVSLNELSYAPEIASAMLKKQQAQALLDARQVVVDGAVKLSQDAIVKLEQGGIRMDDDQKVQIVRNLLTVTCSESAAVPTVSMN